MYSVLSFHKLRILNTSTDFAEREDALDREKVLLLHGIRDTCWLDHQERKKGKLRAVSGLL